MRAEITGLDDLQDRLDGISARLADPEPVMAAIRDDAVGYLQRSIRDGGAPDGDTWAPFDADTVRQGGGGAVLEELAASMVAESMGGASFTLGSSLDFAHFWHYGTQHMPARPILLTPESEIIKKWVGWIEAYVAHGETP